MTQVLYYVVLASFFMENILEISFASFSLPCGQKAYISADAASSPALEILRHAHNMSDEPSGKHLLHIACDGEQDAPLTFRETQGVATAIYRKLPTTAPALASRARNIMFLALLPMLKKREIFLFHGGLCVDDHGYGCIFCGPSGVGKSTAVAKSGKIWEILADDLMYLSFQDGKLLASPGPTWSSYLVGKERFAECNISRVVEVKNIIILSRIGKFGIHPLSGQKAKLLLANSFIEMPAWHAQIALRDADLTAELRKNAFEGVWQCRKTQKIHLLTSNVDTDITPFLRQIM